LSYKSYYLMTSLVQRTREGAEQIAGEGIVEIGPPVATSADNNVQYKYRINQVSLSPALTGASMVQLNGLNFQIRSNVLGIAQMQTSTGVRDGERVVIGTASLKDKGLIVVLSARVIK